MNLKITALIAWDAINLL